MQLRELIQKMNAEKQIQDQEEERLETLIKKGDDLERKVNEMEKRLKKAGKPGIKKAAKLAAGLGFIALVSLGQCSYASFVLKNMPRPESAGIAEIRRDLSSVHNDLGNFYKMHDRAPAAHFQYSRALELDSNNIYIPHNLANLYYNAHEYRKAEEYARKAITIRPDYAPSYTLLGDIYLNQKRYNEAEEEYKKAIKLDPVFLPAYYNISTLYSLMGRPEESERYSLLAEKMRKSGNYNK